MQLFTHREDVDALNSRELTDLPGDSVKFASKDTGNEDSLRISCPVRLSMSSFFGIIFLKHSMHGCI